MELLENGLTKTENEWFNRKNECTEAKNLHSEILKAYSETQRKELNNRIEFIIISIKNGLNEKDAKQLYDTLKADRIKRIGK